MYVFIILLSALFLGVYEIFKKISLKQSNIYEVLFFYCLSGFIFSCFFVGNNLNFNLENSLLTLLKSGILVVNWMLVAKCMQKLNVSIVVTFGLLNSALTVLLSVFLFDESITYIHLIGFILIFIGVIAISLLGRKESVVRDEKYFRYIIYLIVAGILSVASSLFDKFLINGRGMNSKEILFLVMLFNTFIYGVIYFIKNKKIDYKKIKSNYFMVLTGVFLVISDFSYYSSIQIEESKLSIISVLRKCSVLVATILSSIFLKEKNIIKKIVIVIFMMLGIYLIVIKE